MKRIEIDVVDPKQEQAALLAWAAGADKGAPQRAGVPKLHFATYRQLHATLTGKRMDLLEYVATNEVPSIRQLAAQLARDYRNVYDDVQRLVQLGLIEMKPAPCACRMTRSTFARDCAKRRRLVTGYLVCGADSDAEQWRQVVAGHRYREGREACGDR